jgi:hypothetical protein
MGDVSISDFDGFALFEALDARRQARGLSWQGVADQMWELSATLNARRHDHPISPSTITGMSRRGRTSCQHALFMLRWLARSPEDFLNGSHPTPAAPLPEPGPEFRLRWDLKALHAAMNERRGRESLTWLQLAQVLGCSPNQLTGLRSAKFATSMTIAMRIVQWLGRPAAEFVYVASW